MLSSHSLHLADRYWEAHLGDPPGGIYQERFRIITHGGEMVGYAGAFALFREGRSTVSVPPGREEEIGGLLSSDECSPLTLALALVPMASAIIGPTFVGYAEEVAPPVHPARQIGDEDSPAVEALRIECDRTEWEHGGSAIRNPCSGVFSEGQLVALAGYEVWGGTIAPISVITHPDFRGQGWGRSVAAHVVERALDAGLLPQYRTLEGNRPSMRIAESLGFQAYATTMAVKFRT